MKASALGCALAILGSAAIVVAQEPAAPPATPSEQEPAPSPPKTDKSKTKKKELDVVVTGTRTREAAGRAPVRVDVVTKAEAQRRGATNVGEALEGQLGVQVNPSAYGSIGGPSAIQMGGFDRERVLVLSDGERMVGDVGGAIDLSQMPLADVQRIEIVQGPTSALFGSSAIGGVVNVITGPPEQEGASGSAQLEGRYRWGGQANGSFAYRAGAHWVAADSSFYASEGVALAPPEPDLAIPDTWRLGAGLRAGTKLTDDVTVHGRVAYTREAAGGIDSQEVPGLGTFLIDLPEHTDRLNVRVREVVALGKEHELTLSATKQWFWNTTSKDRRDSPLDEHRHRFHTMHSLEVTGSFFQDSVVSFLGGARFEAEAFDQTLERFELIGGEPTRRELVEVVPTTLPSGATYTQIMVKPVEEFTVIGGVRLEGNERYGGAVAPRLALAFQPIDELIFRTSGGRGYRAPSAKEIGFVFDHSVFGYRVIGNPDLEPETSWGLQGDIEARPSKGVRLRASAFANWVDELIDLQLAEGGGGPAGVDDFTYVNVGEALTSGVQVDTMIRANDVLRAEVGYAYLFTRDQGAQRPLPGRPPHTIQTALWLELPFEATVSMRWRFVTDAYLTDEDRAPGFQTLDVRFGKTLWPRAEAYVGSLNVLGVQKDPARFGDQRPVEGRTLYLGIRADFPSET